MVSEGTHYGTTAKTFHWSVAALLTVQLPFGWLMPDIRRGMIPGTAMLLHVSIGMLILLLLIARFVWRLTHPVGPEPSLSRWQRAGSELVHGLLYLTVLAITLSGWLFESMRGWSIDLFGLAPLPRLVAEGSAFGRSIGRWHGTLTWVLLGLVAVHVVAALVHRFYYRNGVMQRMLPR